VATVAALPAALSLLVDWERLAELRHTVLPGLMSGRLQDERKRAVEKVL
jgi:hypothetical protein